MGDSVYVGRHFEGGRDHYSGEKWRRLAENMGLGGNGFIKCSECGSKVHVYSAERGGDGGYNEQLDSYVLFAERVVICGNCLFEAFDSLEVDGKYVLDVSDK